MSKKLNQMIREELGKILKEAVSDAKNALRFPAAAGKMKAWGATPSRIAWLAHKEAGTLDDWEERQAAERAESDAHRIDPYSGPPRSAADPRWTDNLYEGQLNEDAKARLNQMIREELGKLMEQGSDAAAGTGFNVIRKLPPSAPDPDPSITAPSGEPSHPGGFTVAGEEIIAYPEPEETETKRFGTTTLGGGATGGGYKSRFEALDLQEQEATQPPAFDAARAFGSLSDLANKSNRAYETYRGYTSGREDLPSIGDDWAGKGGYGGRAGNIERVHGQLAGLKDDPEALRAAELLQGYNTALGAWDKARSGYTPAQISQMQQHIDDNDLDGGTLYEGLGKRTVLGKPQSPFKRISELALKSYGTCKYED